MVNDTKGSYFTVDTVTENFQMAFYTSGLFDIYPVKREGPVKFCDDGKSLTLVGIGRVETLSIATDILTVDRVDRACAFIAARCPLLYASFMVLCIAVLPENLNELKSLYGSVRSTAHPTGAFFWVNCCVGMRIDFSPINAHLFFLIT